MTFCKSPACYNERELDKSNSYRLEYCLQCRIDRNK